MHGIRHHFVTRFFIGLVTVIILNLSVDAPDYYPNYVPEDLLYNDIESIVEWVLEEVLCMENAIPEHDDDDGTPHKFEKQINYFFETRRKTSADVMAISSHELNFYKPHLRNQSIIDELFQPPEA